MEGYGEKVNCVNLKDKFLKKFFLDSAKFHRKVEFLTLQHGKMTVQVYVNMFEYLARFYS